MRREIGALRAHQSKTTRVLDVLRLDDDEAQRTIDRLRGGVPVDDIAADLEAGDPTSASASAPGKGKGKERERDHERDHEREHDQERERERERAEDDDMDHSAFDPFSHDSAAAWTLTSSAPSSATDSTLPWSPMMSVHHSYSPYASIAHLPASITVPPVPDGVHRARKHGQSIILPFPAPPLVVDSKHALPDPPRSTLVWTSLTTDDDMIEHLLALYFCWEYPAFASLSKDHFWADYYSGKIDHCSPLLVNAILALGCRFSDDPAVRADPHDGNTAGELFYDEAKRLLALQTDRHVVTTIQALSLMSLYQASHGSTSAGMYYAGQAIRLATEMGLHRRPYDTPESPIDSHLDETVRTATFWGAYSLNQCVSGPFLLYWDSLTHLGLGPYVLAASRNAPRPCRMSPSRRWMNAQSIPSGSRIPTKVSPRSPFLLRCVKLNRSRFAAIACHNSALACAKRLWQVLRAVQGHAPGCLRLV